VSIGAGSNDRAVANPTRYLAGHTPGRGGDGEIAVAVARDRPYGAMQLLLVVILGEAAMAALKLGV
jgi:hypothetical protein